jgi:hypothetical protein
MAHHAESQSELRKMAPVRVVTGSAPLAGQSPATTEAENISKSGAESAQCRENPFYLLLGCIKRPGVVDHEIGGFDLLFVRNLRCHAARHFDAGSVF